MRMTIRALNSNPSGILVNDAEIRQLAEPWLDNLDELLAGRTKTVH